MQLLDPSIYSPDIVALNPDLFCKAREPKAAKTQKRPDTELEIKFLSHWQLCNGPNLERDYTGWTDKKYEIDFYHPASRVGIEINGGIGKKSGHTSWTGIHRDYEKLMLATQAGIRLVYLGTKHLRDDEILIWISLLLRLVKKD